MGLISHSASGSEQQQCLILQVDWDAQRSRMSTADPAGLPEVVMVKSGECVCVCVVEAECMRTKSRKRHLQRKTKARLWEYLSSCCSRHHFNSLISAFYHHCMSIRLNAMNSNPNSLKAKHVRIDDRPRAGGVVEWNPRSQGGENGRNPLWFL